MATKRFHAMDAVTGQKLIWRFGTFKNILNCGGNVKGKGRRISGWTLVSPDGLERNHEGNWESFIPYANLILSNYGCKPSLS